MARDCSMTSRIERLAKKGAHKSWSPLFLVMLAIALLLSSVKALGVLLPYINGQLF